MGLSRRRIALVTGVIGGGAAEWTPASESGLLFWLSADKNLLQTIGGVVAGDGQKVGRWGDRSAAVNGTWMTGDNRPTLRANQVNGLPAVQFASAGNEAMIFDSVIEDQPVSVFAVVNHVSDKGAGEALLGLDKHAINVRSAGSNALSTFYGTTQQSTLVLGTDFAVLGFIIANYNDVKIRMNASEQSFSNGTSWPNFNNSVLASAGGGGVAPNIKIAEIFAYAGAKSAGVVASAEAYLAAKYGITLSF